MSTKVILTNKSQQTNELGQLDRNSTVLASRTIYQKLRSLTSNKTIKSDYDNGLIPQELKKLFDNFTILYDSGTATPGVQALDEYLGNLGVTETYPFTKDIISIDMWFSVEEQEPIRNVIDDNGNNVIYLEPITNITYNVIHLT